MARSAGVPWPLLLLGGVAVGGLAAALFGTAGGREVVRKAEREAEDIERRIGMYARDILHYVSKNEGTYTSVNRNSDGAGASFGIIQWAQVTGDLYKLLLRMQQRDPVAFSQATGGRGDALLAATKDGGKRPADGANVWDQPWLGRLQALGNVPAFRAVQDEMALEGHHWKLAETCAATLGIRTARAMALFYDTAVQQGESSVTFAQRLRTWLEDQEEGGKQIPYAQVLASYAWLCSARFTSDHYPGEHPSAPRLQWRQVGSNWHVFAGSIDLYADVKRRREKILADPSLNDDPLVA